MQLLGDSRDTVFLKLENEMPTGSFKVRGALHALTRRLERSAVSEVVASSTGNHGAAVAFAAQKLGVPATIFLPRGANPVKRAKIAALGAKIIESGADLAEAFNAAARYVTESHAYFLNDATDPDVPDGAGTIADEIVDDCPSVGTIYVPMGDTALIRGVAARAKKLKPSVTIVGVQADRAPSYYLSWRAGSVVTTPTADTIADGLATRTPERANVAEIRALVDDVRLVTEEAMLAAIRILRDRADVVAEPSGAASVAAYMQEPPTATDRTVVLLVSGGNVDPAVLARIV